MKSYVSSYLLIILTVFFSIALSGFSERKQQSEHLFIYSDDPKPAVTVGMTNALKFTPDTVRIKAGQTVLWKNSSLLVHSVTADPSEGTIEGSVKLPKGARSFNSGLMDPEEIFEHTFNKPGSYTYFCIPHEAARMRGVVIVRAN